MPSEQVCTLLWIMFFGASDLSRLAPVLFAETQNALKLAALAGVTSAGQATLWLANLTTDTPPRIALTAGKLR